MLVDTARVAVRVAHLGMLLAMFGILGGAPLPATELWLEARRPIYDPAPPATDEFASPELAQAVGDDWTLDLPVLPLTEPLVDTPLATCACGQPIACRCGACLDCCQCSQPVHGLIYTTFDPWEGTLEIGLNGADGNTNNSNLFFGFDGKREYRAGSWKFDVDYFYQKADSLVTADRLVALSRYERDIGYRSLSWYLEGQYEADQLRNYDGRVSMASGLAAPLKETDRLALKGRLGFGASKKINAPDDQWRPELQMGVDYDYRLTERQRLFGNLDYYPDISDFSTYRLNFKLGWEACLEEQWGLALRASINNWYDSDPGPGTVANDLYYVLSLTWGY